MNKREEIKKLWREAFNDSADYVDMYFNKVYRDDEAMTLERDGRIVSSLLLQHYGFMYQGREMSIGYIAGATTRRKDRGNGFMKTLMCDALQEAAARGEMLVALIPAHDWLYYYYEPLGFARVFFVDAERYTSLHSFTIDPTMTEVDTTDPTAADRLYNAFHDLECERRCGVVHSRRDFDNIVTDNAMDGGDFVAVARADGAIGAMAFAVVRDNTVVVTDILADGGNSRQSVLATLRLRHPDTPFKVLAPPDDNRRRRLTERGMGRIVNARKCLAAIATANPSLKMRVRVTDPIVKTNNGIWRIGGGEMVTEPADTDAALDYDVDIATFTSLVFSSPRLQSVLNLPAVRPVMSLMLD